jgi:hypothetical protein
MVKVTEEAHRPDAIPTHLVKKMQMKICSRPESKAVAEGLVMLLLSHRLCPQL